MAVRVPHARGEEARACLIDLFPEGFEEGSAAGELELAAYTDDAGVERIRRAFGQGAVTEIAEDWAERWRDFHAPVRVGPLWIGPPWLEPPADATPVVIDPGRAFGTGAHPTTRLCIELLLERGRTSLLDVGCGSGVVSIAAARLGFGPVRAIDVDPAAVDATRSNAAVNGVVVDAGLVDALEADLPEAGLAVANIALEPVRLVAGRLRSRRLIASGYLAAGDPAPLGWRRLVRRTAAGWAADLYERE